MIVLLNDMLKLASLSFLYLLVNLELIGLFIAQLFSGYCMRVKVPARCLFADF